MPIKKKKIGFVHTQNNHKSLAKFLIKIYKKSEWKNNFKKACLETFKSEFSNEVILGKWKKIVN